ncbi:MAG: tRNA (adenosine(37)-N6)-dimethylallyltransferase MiaA [Desulfobacteraceae bacterium]|nr:tRNA (adenosine(37)-N6)-dimethylallyltransferase MiaA [Desulfobacteraceae bacterium]
MRESKEKARSLHPFPLVAVLGPTAVGKTALSIRLASELRAEIVNFDSVQVYRGLDIGSAKPTKKELARVPHHLIDILQPDEPFNAAAFSAKARAAIKSITQRGRTVILTGGTNLYLRALLEGLAPCPGEDHALRTRLKEIAKEFGTDVLHAFLSGIDTKSASRIHPNDTLRIIRAIEVYIKTGKTLSLWHERHQNEMVLSHCIKIGLMRPINELYERIDRRVDEMIKDGLIEEVRSLIKKGYSPDIKPLQTLGYRHMIRFLAGASAFTETVVQLKRDHRHYARRQLIWLRNKPDIKWFNPDGLARLRRIWPHILGAKGN